VAEWCSREAARWKWDGRTVHTPEWRWRGGTLVYLKVENHRELEWWIEHLGDKAVVFQEPHWGWSSTALAVLGEGDVPDLLASLPLL